MSFSFSFTILSSHQLSLPLTNSPLHLFPSSSIIPFPYSFLSFLSSSFLSSCFLLFPLLASSYRAFFTLVSSPLFSSPLPSPVLSFHLVPPRPASSPLLPFFLSFSFLLYSFLPSSPHLLFPLFVLLLVPFFSAFFHLSFFFLSSPLLCYPFASVLFFLMTFFLLLSPLSLLFTFLVSLIT